MKQQWRLAFADPGQPEGEQFLGVVIVEAGDLGGAIDEAWRLRVNPGGQLFGRPLPLGTYPPQFTDRLLTRDDVARMEVALQSSGPFVA